MMNEFFQSDIDTIPNNLPPRPKDFTNRDDEIIKLLGYAERPWRIVITGFGGIGKTTLALESVYRLAETKNFDAIIWTSAKRFELGATETKIRNPFPFKRVDVERKINQGIWVDSFAYNYTFLRQIGTWIRQMQQFNADRCHYKGYSAVIQGGDWPVKRTKNSTSGISGTLDKQRESSWYVRL